MQRERTFLGDRGRRADEASRGATALHALVPGAQRHITTGRRHPRAGGGSAGAHAGRCGGPAAVGRERGAIYATLLAEGEIGVDAAAAREPGTVAAAVDCAARRAQRTRHRRVRGTSAGGTVRLTGGGNLSHLCGGLALDGAVQGSGDGSVRGRASEIIFPAGSHVVRLLEKVIAGHRVITRPDGALVVGGTLEQHALVEAQGVAERETRRGCHRGITRRHHSSVRTRHSGKIKILFALNKNMFIVRSG